jgi:hypothetical protein
MLIDNINNLLKVHLAKEHIVMKWMDTSFYRRLIYNDKVWMKMNSKGYIYEILIKTQIKEQSFYCCASYAITGK